MAYQDMQAHADMAAAMMQAAAQGMAQPQAQNPTGEPKGALNHFCQRYCRRPVTKEDIVYTSAKYGKVFQVTVTLNCMEGQAFVGETAADLKGAEKNAAYQALLHFEPLVASLPEPENKNKKKRKVPGAEGAAAEEPAYKAMKMVAGVGGGGGTMALGDASNPAMTAKVVLNTLCMKMLRRPMTKGEVIYETHQTPIGFQSTVRLPCLPGEWGGLAWAGEVATQQKTAEQNAAQEALKAVQENHDQIKSLLPEQPMKHSSGKGYQGWMDGKGGGGWMDGKGGGGWKGKGGKGFKGGWDYWGGDKGGMKGMGMDMGMAGGPWPEFEGNQRPRGPLPRTRISEVPITGEIVEWKGKYGWLKPHAEISHPMAKKRGGRIFMGSKDVVGEVELTEGAMLQFHVYEDPTGLGAEEVNAF